MTELSFLLDLLLNHRLQKATKDLIRERIKEVEQGIPLTPQGRANAHLAAMPAISANPIVAQQAPSMQAIMARHPDLGNPDLAAPVTPVAVVAQTAATQAALASRQQAIAESIAGKIDKVTGRPKKF